jgi:hypothetical protein
LPPDLDYRKFTLARIDAFINQIQLLHELDFPYNDSKTALTRISQHINEQKLGVENSVLETDALQSRCARATSELYVFHRFLGYITKSADPANSFEIYFSFRRLAENILGKGTQLIISSEWEYYSPVYFKIPKELKDFVFIGFPICEAENSLLVPLTGHELGHSIWFRNQFKEKYWPFVQKSLKERIPKNLDEAVISYIVEITLNKCAEYFCDFIGIGIFGESYLYAFAYLIAPKISKELNKSHPNARHRATAMIEASRTFGCTVPVNFNDLFKTQFDPLKSQEFGLEESETISLSMIDFLITDVKLLLTEKKVLYSKSDHYEKIKSELLSVIPTSSANSLADITNAAWDVFFSLDSWNVLAKAESEKVALLNELTIKSFEILEIKQRLHQDDTEVR